MQGDTAADWWRWLADDPVGLPFPFRRYKARHPACYARPGESFSEAEENVIGRRLPAVRAGITQAGAR
jgi:hypothetical protein